MNKKNNKAYLYGVICYTIWGILPFYWKTLDNIDAKEVLAYRITWSSIVIFVAILLLGKLPMIWQETKKIFQNKRKTIYLLAGTLLISLNWLLFIASVHNGNVIEASLGYYINPMVNVLVALLFLKERLNQSTAVACGFATIGVVILSVQTGSFPWYGVGMAVTFSLYGLIKKTVDIQAATSLLLETLLMLPFALLYIMNFGGQAFMSFGLSQNSLLIGTGVVTVIPLLLFAVSAKQISYIVMGFIQYIGPTLMLISAIFFFKESFTWVQLGGFACIWFGILIFIGNSLHQAKLLKKVGE